MQGERITHEAKHTITAVIAVVVAVALAVLLWNPVQSRSTAGWHNQGGGIIIGVIQLNTFHDVKPLKLITPVSGIASTLSGQVFSRHGDVRITDNIQVAAEIVLLHH